MDARIFPVLNRILLLLGAGFSVANALILFEYIVYRRRRPGALLVWRRPATPDYGLSLAIGVVLGLIVFYKLVYLHRQVFGEGMMFLYYAYLLPLSRTIGRGFYDEGIWADSSFVPYNEVGGISWREGDHLATLVVISRLRNLARKLSVPLEHYAAARRLLRDKISAHDIQFAGTALDLGGHDERTDI